VRAAEVAFDFDDVTPTVRRAHSAATREDAEDAVMTAVAEGIEKGWELTSRNVVACARFRLLSALERRERRNLSLDSFAEDDGDSVPVELAVEEVDFDAHVELSTARSNPILRQRLEDGLVKAWSRELIAEALRAVHREDGKLPVSETMKTDPRLPAQSVFYRYYDSWEEAVRAAGLVYTVPPPRNRWTVEQGTAVLKEWTAAHGRLPTADELRNGSALGLPSQMACYRLFGSCSQSRLAEVVWGEEAGRIHAAMVVLREPGPGSNEDLAARLGEFCR
jgi:hypothetical protein